jgi:hypothetical protein
MIKKQQKWIAIFVVCAFAWMMHVAALPVAAAETTAPAVQTGSEQGPNFIEGEGSAAPKAGGRSVLPWILIGVGVITVTALVFILFALNKYDITGTWNFHLVSITYPGDTFDWQLTFTGTKKSGTFIDDDGYTGTYSVDGKTVTSIRYNGDDISFTGEFTAKDTMSGTYTWAEWSEVGTWTATRLGGAAAIRTPARSGQIKDRQPRRE